MISSFIHRVAMKLMEIEMGKIEDPLCALFQIEPECTPLEREALSLVCELLDDIEDPNNLKDNIKTKMNMESSIQGKITWMLQRGMKDIIEKEQNLKKYL